MLLGKNIALARQRAGITQPELGAVFGITYQAVSQWERNETVPEIEKIPLIATKLNVSIGWLLTGESDVADEEAWAIWKRLNPDQRKQAIRVLKALAGEPELV